MLISCEGRLVPHLEQYILWSQTRRLIGTMVDIQSELDSGECVELSVCLSRCLLLGKTVSFKLLTIFRGYINHYFDLLTQAVIAMHENYHIFNQNKTDNILDEKTPQLSRHYSTCHQKKRPTNPEYNKQLRLQSPNLNITHTANRPKTVHTQQITITQTRYTQTRAPKENKSTRIVVDTDHEAEQRRNKLVTDKLVKAQAVDKQHIAHYTEIFSNQHNWSK